MVLTHLKNIRQIGSFPQVGVDIKKNIWNHHLVKVLGFFWTKKVAVAPFCMICMPVWEQIEQLRLLFKQSMVMVVELQIHTDAILQVSYTKN